MALVGHALASVPACADAFLEINRAFPHIAITKLAIKFIFIVMSARMDLPYCFTKNLP
jgi:hypothetical protein